MIAVIQTSELNHEVASMFVIYICCSAGKISTTISRRVPKKPKKKQGNHANEWITVLLYFSWMVAANVAFIIIMQAQEGLKSQYIVLKKPFEIFSIGLCMLNVGLQVAISDAVRSTFPFHER